MNYIDIIANQIYQTVHPNHAIVSDTEMLLYRIYAILMLAKGQNTTLEDVHNAWAVLASDRRPEHRYLVPFQELAPDVQQLDKKYVDAIHAVAALHTLSI